MNPAMTTLDCRGMRCPAPILEIAKTARQVGSESYVLQVLADDDDFPKDVDAWCRASRATLHELLHEGSVYRAVVGLNGASKPESAPPRLQRPQLQRRPPPPQNRAPLHKNGASSHQSSAPTFEDQLTSAPMFSDLTVGAQMPADQTVSAQQAMALPPFSDRRTSAEPSIDIEPPLNFEPPMLATQPAVPKMPPPEAPRPHAAAPITAPHRPPQPTADSGVVQVDLRGHRAPAPIRHLSSLLNTHPGHRVRVVSDDPSFLGDLTGWCSALRVNIARTQKDDLTTVVELDLPGSAAQAKSPVSLVPEIEPSPDADVAPRENIASLCVLRGDFESLMASMLVANGAAAQGMKVHIYFAFWGVNVLRGERPRAGVPGGQTTWLQRLMKWMMPRGPHRQKMSKMHMAGIGKGAMQSFMRKYDVMSLPQLLDSCVEQNITFIVCTMSMNMMGVEKRDIMDLPNIEWGGVSTFVERSKRSAMSLVF